VGKVGSELLDADADVVADGGHHVDRRCAADAGPCPAERVSSRPVDRAVRVGCATTSTGMRRSTGLRLESNELIGGAMVAFLTIVSGLAWTVVYLECIRVGLRERTYAMPLAALGLNIAWESTYAAHDLAGTVHLQGWINLVWALTDLIIVYTFFRFGRSEFPTLSGRLFAAGGMLVFASSYVVQWLFIGEFGWAAAARYSAFLQNLLMSGLFIAMLVARGGRRGQSMVIAVAKWVGTLAPTLIFGVHERSSFILGIGILCGVFDVAYIGLLWTARAAGRASRVDRPGPGDRQAVISAVDGSGGLVPDPPVSGPAR
jgi:hypothetical protein